MSDPKYTPGQVLIRRDANEARLHGPQRVTVTKVGRKLLTVTTPHGATETFRIEDGIKNDNVGHGWVQTPEEYEEGLARRDVAQRLASHGLRWDSGNPSRRWTVATLNKVADLLDAERLP